jgi:hypothetical protein
VTGVCDPRQGTYSTTRSSKNKKFKRAGIQEWIEEKAAAKLIAVEPRVDCYRSNQMICDYADALFPHLPKSVSKNGTKTQHDGVFFIPGKDVHKYHNEHKPVVLRWNKKSETLGLNAYNFGQMKGRTFDRVLIFPTGPMKAYFKSKDPSDAGDLSKFYVAITRARYSVAFVV